MPKLFMLGPKEFQLMDKLQPEEYIQDRAKTFQELYGLHPELTAKVISTVYPHRAKRPWTDAEVREQLGLPEATKIAVSSDWIYARLRALPGLDKSRLDRALSRAKVHALQHVYLPGNMYDHKYPKRNILLNALENVTHFTRSPPFSAANTIEGFAESGHKSLPSGSTTRNWKIPGLAALGIAVPLAGYGLYKHLTKSPEQEKTSQFNRMKRDEIWTRADNLIADHQSKGLMPGMSIPIGEETYIPYKGYTHQEHSAKRTPTNYATHTKFDC